MNSPLEPGMMVVHGNRMEDLRALALAWLQCHPLAPLENELILVQSNGVAQWLKLALAKNPGGPDGGMGVAAAIDVQLPSRFLWQAYRAVLGAAAIPLDSPFDKEPLAWRIMRLLPALAAREDFAPLAAYLADDPDRRKRHQLAERLADLLDQYQVYRADWLRQWARGESVLLDVHGQPRPLPAGQGWQPQLWRALMDDIAADPASSAATIPSRAEVHARFLERAQALASRPAGLPRRIVVFGISSLPAQSLHALSALSRFCQILLFVHNPCQHYWADIVTGKELLRAARRRQAPKAGLPPDADESALHLHAHPLLAAWGRQGRDYIRLLDEFDAPENYRHRFRHDGIAPELQRIDLFSAPGATALLAQLQEDILELRPLADTRELHPPVAAGRDHSLRFHIAHSPQREVEILHDQLLHRFNADRALQPREVIVMVPDIDRYAPHIQAVFGQFDPADPRYIPYTLADRRRRGCEPLLLAVEHLVSLPQSRFAASEVLDLLDVPAIRRRFAIAAEDLPALHRWIDGAGVRWGLDSGQRQSLDLPGLEQNTWRFGLSRMLLGYAVGGAGSWQGIEPHDEIGGLDAALLGPLALLLERLEDHWQSLQHAAPPAEWGRRLRGLLQDFFLPADEGDTLLLAQLDQLLEQWENACEASAFADPLPLNVAREAWLGKLDQGGLSQRFMAGAVNFCTLMPMRAIPFKVVCLLGMNDGDYPRPQAAADFDLMARDYRPGDRSRREDDRYLFLEALLSARDQLYISWVGRSVRDNSERPPSVLVGQLRDHLAAGWRPADPGLPLLAALTLEHPLQPFSPAYFDRRQGEGRLFSYAHEWIAGNASLALPLPPAGEGAPADALLPPPDPLPLLTLAALAQFLRNPVKYFFNRRLKIHFEEDEEALEDSEPFGLDALDQHQLGETLLQAALRDRLEPARQRLRGLGRLPLGGYGELVLDQLCAPLPDLVERYREALAQWPEILPESEILFLEHETLRLEDWLGSLRRNAANEVARVLPVAWEVRKNREWQYHRLLPYWVGHMAAGASGLPLATLLVAADETLSLPPLPRETARTALLALLSGWLAGMRAPLPVAPRTAFQWLEKLAKGDPGEKGEAQAARAARQAYEGNDFQARGECAWCSYLSRQYPDFALLQASGQFAHWAESLYRPLHTLLNPPKAPPPGAKE